MQILVAERHLLFYVSIVTYNNLIDIYCSNTIMQVAASFASEGSVMNELKQWNDLYGEGGSRKKEQLTYFL